MTDLLTVIRIALDTGVLVLIWLVQLVIYPSFAHYQKADLKRWHRLYTNRVTYIAFPLMTSQLAFYLYLMYIEPVAVNVVTLLLVAAAWGITFMKAVPLHGAIAQASDDRPCLQLVAVNKGRVAIWTAVWLISVFEIINT